MKENDESKSQSFNKCWIREQFNLHEEFNPCKFAPFLEALFVTEPLNIDVNQMCAFLSKKLLVIAGCPL